MASNEIMLHKEARWGFSYIRLDSAATMRKVLSLTPHKFEKGMAIFHSWILSFDTRRLVGLAIRVWISLRLLPLEYLDYVCTIVGFVEKVVEEDPRVTVTQDPRFCVELDLERGWISMLELPEYNGRFAEVVIEYDGEPIRCSQCFQLNHPTKHCRLRAHSTSEPAPASRYSR